MLLNLIKRQRAASDKVYSYVKDAFQWKDQLIINERETFGIKKLKNSKAFTNYFALIIDDVYENLEEYNPTKKNSVDSV